MAEGLKMDSIAPLIFNLPLYAMGWMFVGRRFFVYSIFGLVIFSLTVDRLPGFLFRCMTRF